MGVTKTETLEASDGLDQLERKVGAIVAGDEVHVRYQGYYKASNGKLKEFQDMFHSERLLQFKVGSSNTASPSHFFFSGLDDAVRLMVLGEKARFEVTADCAFGAETHKGLVTTVPANSDLVVELTIFKAGRDGVLHYRKQPKDTACCLTKLLYGCFRAY